MSVREKLNTLELKYVKVQYRCWSCAIGAERYVSLLLNRYLAEIIGRRTLTDFFVHLSASVLWISLRVAVPCSYT